MGAFGSRPQFATMRHSFRAEVSRAFGAWPDLRHATPLATSTQLIFDAVICLTCGGQISRRTFGVAACVVWQTADAIQTRPSCIAIYSESILVFQILFHFLGLISEFSYYV